MSVISRRLNPNRSLSLDVFRGMTLAGMILVNNPGGPASYAPLRHADWNGWTPTDLVFPSFAFILGAAVSYSYENRNARKEWAGLSLFDYMVPILTAVMYLVKFVAQTGFFKHGPQPAITAWDLTFPVIFIAAIMLPKMERRANADGGNLYLRAVHHGFLIFAIGFIWSYDPTNPGHFRFMGVLQRLGLVYLFTSLIALRAGRRGQAVVAAGLLALYWILMKYVPVPGCGAGVLSLDCNLAGYVDNLVLKGHLYRPTWDPEGLLHTIPAIATGLLGCLAGGWMREEKSLAEKAAGLFVAGCLLAFAGSCLDYWFPINKNLWTPSYVLFAGGLDMIFLGFCVWFVDFRGRRKFVAPFVHLGSNSILIYMLSGVVIHYVSFIPAGQSGGADVNVKQALYNGLCAAGLSPNNASLAMALAYVALWACIAGIFYRKNIFFKI